MVYMPFQAWMPRGNLRHRRHVLAAGEEADGKVLLLADGPEPVERAVGPPGFLMRLVEGEPEAEHARALAPVGHDLFAVGALEIEMPEDAELVRMLAPAVDRLHVDRLAERAGWMDHRAVDPCRGHLFQRVIDRIGRNLAMLGTHSGVLPEVDLRIDYQHAVLSKA